MRIEVGQHFVNRRFSSRKAVVTKTGSENNFSYVEYRIIGFEDIKMNLPEDVFVLLYKPIVNSNKILVFSCDKETNI